MLTCVSVVRAWQVLVSGCVALLLHGSAEAQLQQTTVTAIVLDARQAPVAGAQVALTDARGAELHRLTTDVSGRAVFRGVAPGRYELTTETATPPIIQLPLSVVGALPLEITVRVPAAVTDRVVVEGLADETTARGSVAGASIARVPTRVRSRAIQDVVATLPGWSTEDNGLLHTRGVDDGFLYVIDGVPVYERLDAVSGISPDVSSIGSINVITGYVAPEFGYKAGGVIDVRSAVANAWSANTDALLGGDRSRDVTGAVGGPLGDRVGIRVGGAASASNRYLDPVHPDNFHNHGGQANTFGQLEWAVTTSDRISTGWGLGRARFDVPNNEDQEPAGQDQRQRLAQAFANATWQRTWLSNLVTQAAGYHRRSDAQLDGSPADTPLEAHADRALTRTGVLFAATMQQHTHLMKAGFEWQHLALDEVFGFAITDEDEARDAGFRDEALVFDIDNPFSFSGVSTPTLFAAFVQDTWRVSSQFTLSGGVRFDSSHLLLPRTQWSPRVGVAYRVSDATLLRGSLSRYFQPPQPENLLLSSSEEARALSSIVVEGDEGGADIEPERQWGSELGVEHRIGHVRIDVAYWRRSMRNVADPNVFAGTTVIFPNAVDQGRAQGVEMRVEVPRYRGWSGYANAAVSKVVQIGPINGGLFLEEEVEEIGPGVEFTPDHDQRFTAAAGLTWEHSRSHLALSVTARYETGTPVPVEDDELAEWLEQPGAELVDFDSGRVKPRTVVSVLASVPLFTAANVMGTVGMQVLNLFDAPYAYNFGNPFSGTHFGAPRTVAVSLRLQFQ
jgi:outer membrane receptor for ferrienterochelin and colicin